jgi:molybdopterin molybdotransferase
MQAFEACGVMPVFHKIRQKPGKPILFGRKENKAVFGLPGNPASVLTCFYEYVLPAIGKMMHQPLSLSSKKAVLSHDHQKPAGLTHFLKAVYDGEKVSLQKGQESYKLSSFAVANCLVVFPETETQFTQGQSIEIHLLP